MLQDASYFDAILIFWINRSVGVISLLYICFDVWRLQRQLQGGVRLLIC